MSNGPTTTWRQGIALMIVSPLVFLVLCEGLVRVLGIDTELARNANAQIALPVWLLADEVWVSDRERKLHETDGAAIQAEEVEWLYHFEEARWVQYKMKPGVDARALNPFNEWEVAQDIKFGLSSNLSGFRTDEFTEKKPGIVRIVTVGDSSTFGWGNEPEDTFQAILYQRLTQTLPGRVEIFNLGIPGHNSRHGLGVLRHYARQLDPDLVIVSFGANDPRMVPTATDALLAVDDTWRGALRHGLLRLRTYRLLRRLLLTAADPIRSAQRDRAAGRAKVAAVSIEDFRSNLEAFQRENTAAGSATLFLSVCTSERTYAASMRDVAAREGAPFLDVRALFSEHIDDLVAGRLLADKVDHYRQLYGADAFRDRFAYYVTSDGCHPHAVGNTLIADALVPLVQQILELPTLSSPESGDTP